MVVGQMADTAVPKSITLALGGGGARGVAHLGVVEVLMKAGYTIERIVGVSMGSLAGAACAFEPDIHKVQQKCLAYLLSDSFQHHQQVLFGTTPKSSDETTGGIFSWYERVKKYLHKNRHLHRVVTKPSLLPGIVLHDVVNNLLPAADIADAKIPLSIVAVDLRSGHRVVLEKGPVRQVVRASSSLPGIWPPVELDGMLLCDIGVFYSLPTTMAQAYAPNCLVAVDVSSGIRPLTDCETAFDVLMRMDEIGEALFRKRVVDAADLVIQPEVAGLEWFDFSSPENMIAIGRQAASRAIPHLKAFFTKREAAVR